jgi:hypothetical protein
VPYLPPTHPPLLLLDLDFRRPDPTLTLARALAVVDGRLALTAAGPGEAACAPIGSRAFRDVIFETVLRLTAGADEDRYGIFVRNSDDGRYVSCTVSPAGVLAVRHFTGSAFEDIAIGDLAPGMTFAPGLDEPNLFHVVACGPQLTLVLNEKVIMGVTVERGLAEGRLGFVVEHLSASSAATVAADWAQVRAVLPPARYGNSVIGRPAGSA